ncbi:MAG: NnrU family protein, partial [Stappiaceae bacterium]
MALLILGLILFIGIHLLPVFSSAGASVKSKLGPAGYKGLFFLVSLAGLILVVVGYGNARSDGPLVLYDPPLFLRHVVLLLMLPVFVLF